jgi:hypothetical protein
LIVILLTLDVWEEMNFKLINIPNLTVSRPKKAILILLEVLEKEELVTSQLLMLYSKTLDLSKPPLTNLLKLLPLFYNNLYLKESLLLLFTSNFTQVEL